MDKLYCRHGHELTAENLYVSYSGRPTGKPLRNCKACHKNASFLREHGISWDAFQETELYKRKICSRCGGSVSRPGFVHNTETNEIVEVICWSCNRKRFPQKPRTRCKKGHELTEENTLIRGPHKVKLCRICVKENSRAWDLANPEKVLASRKKVLAKPDYKQKRKEWEDRTGYVKKRSLKRKCDGYKISPEMFLGMYEKQEGLCKICREKMAVPCIDHNHTSGKVRDLLCVTCNAGLGNFKENPDIFLSAVEYLKYHA